MKINREDLYKRVWETPLTKLAKEFNISDVGLAKACRRSKIPTPPVGYWAKVAHGKSVPKPPLPSASDTSLVLEPERHRQENSSLALTAEEFPGLQVEVLQDLDGLAPFTAATYAHLSKGNADSAGFLVCGSSSLFSCANSAGSIERTAYILNAIERALPLVGARLVRDAENKRLSVDVDGEKITFSIAEKYSRTEHVIKHAQYAWMNQRTYEYHFKGELKLTIDGSYAGQKGWSDGARARLEEKLGNFVVGLVGAARATRKLREEREAQRLRWEEAAKIRQHKDAQLRKLRAFKNHFAAEAVAWHQYNQAYEYLEHLKQSLAGNGEHLAESSSSWLAIAEQSVADLDPSQKRLHLLRTGFSPSEWEAPFGGTLVHEPSAA
ncbi:hypothetical protein [Polaromonas sp.]|uniref:hypothetical protein n=1 Tax=Polaromonas sp. TaxID=1869339 RepID=UPI001811FD4D|nr:hypothetical protein [Polaromonas sp.]NMM06965.1 hypothetical protein [Polaromonas sp.]